ncbi:YrbL family protein [Vibrio cortegadensis]|uniref:YrbL family protein n=1 Tax=Vibrio cortegadensis TaxID=1328770 RepID=UPI00352CA0B6
MRDFTQWKVIGKGAERTCYQDPDDKSRCIKVSDKNRSKQTYREIKYFKFLTRKKVSFDHIPNFYSVIENDDYLGIEQEIILDASGLPSKTLYAYLSDARTTKEMDVLYLSLDVFKKYLLDNNIIPSDLNCNNLLVTEISSGVKIHMIDGFGSSEVIPLANYFSLLGRNKINRKWTRFLCERFHPAIKQCQPEHFDISTMAIVS